MKFISSFILSLCSVWSFSQTILYQAETTSRTVQDPETVIMAQGFHAKSDVSNPFVAKLGPATDNPGGGPISSDAGANNPSGTTEGTVKFHDTKGNIEVNGAGQLQFTLPIALPPGVKSVAPQISLVYTSGSGNGIAGYGWNISGITSISRMGKNIEKDGELKGIQLDYSDYYSFNGQRLILKSGEYGKDGAEYVTEKYSNVKIKSAGNYLDIGPAHFEVTFEDGSQAWYGAYKPGGRSNPEVTTPLEYNIVKWKDSQGNYISYDYVSNANNGGFRISNRTMRISSIWWGGNETLNKPHFNSIEFTYIDRDLKEQSYIQGSEYTQNKILSEIKVVSNGNQFKKYIVDYFKNGTNYQFVNKITEYNLKDESATAVVFENESNPQITNIFRQDNRFDDIYEAKVSGDFNGDGKLDFIKGNTLMLGRLDGTGNFYTINYEGDLLNAVSFIENGILNTQQNLVTGKIEHLQKTLKLQFSGFNNTGSFVNKQTLSYDLSTIIPGLSNSSCSNNWGQFNFPPIITLSSKEGDFNGDGISDLLINVRRRIRCPRGMDVTWLTNLYIDYKNGIIKKLDENKTLDLISVSDFNGDGKSDLLRIENNELNVYSLNAQNDFTKIFSTSKESFNNILYLGDFNGDGKTDILAPIAEESSDWRMYISTGNGFRKEYYPNLSFV